MKLFIANLFLVLSFGVFTVVSAKQAEEISVQINHQVNARGGVKVRFLELVDDSRCPTDTNCVWAGNATIKVRVVKNGRSKVIELETMGDKAVTHAGFSFKLVGLTPAPRSNIRINRNGYVATIEVKKVK